MHKVCLHTERALSKRWFNLRKFFTLAQISRNGCQITPLHRCTFSNFFSGGFITAIVVVNPPERKLAKRTSLQYIKYVVLILILIFLHRDDFSPKFVALFTILLFLKSFHWLAEDRVDYMERSPSISMLFHVRVISLAALVSMI